MPGQSIRDVRAAKLRFHDQYGKDLSIAGMIEHWTDGRYELRLRLKEEPQITIPPVFEGLPIRVEVVKSSMKMR
jgi:hypothetical protein